MSSTVTLSQPAYKNLVSRLSRLEKMMDSLMDIFEKEPQEGTQAWWERSDKQAHEDIKKGDYYTLKNKKDIGDFFRHINDDKYVFNKFHHKSKKTNSITL